MKKVKAALSFVLALSVVFCLAVTSASAAEPGDDISPADGIYILSDEEVAALPSTCALGAPKVAVIPRTNTNGTNANSIFPSFKAESRTYEFRIISIPGATTYNVGLCGVDPVTGQINTAAVPQLRKYIGESVYFGNLEVGQYYYFIISSYDVPGDSGYATYQYGPA